MVQLICKDYLYTNCYLVPVLILLIELVQHRLNKPWFETTAQDVSTESSVHCSSLIPVARCTNCTSAVG